MKTSSLIVPIAALAVAAIPVLALEPVYEEHTVFRSGTDGYHTYRIPAIVRATNGDLLAFAEGRVNNSRDHDDVDLVLKRSTDNGDTWSHLEVVWGSDDAGLITWGNPCPVVDQSNGRVWLACNLENYQVFTFYSDDNGKTWSKPRDITDQAWNPAWPRPPEPALASWTGPGIGIQIEHGPHAGRLVIPMHLRRYPLTNSEQNEVSSFYSDDHGNTWHYSTNTTGVGNEPQVVELTDGRLAMNQRNQNPKADPRFRLMSYSSDGGESWSPSRPDEHLNGPIVQGSLLRFRWPDVTSSDKGVILFAMPDGPKRERLTVRASLDDGATWAASRIVRDGFAAYSCMVRQADDRAGILYEAGSYKEIVYGRFGMDWLLDSRETSVAPASVATLPTIDFSGKTDHHVVIAQGTADTYQGHPTTLLLPDKRTMFCVWTINHGGYAGPMKRSDDGGLTWSDLIPVPENWSQVRNCPAIYRLLDPTGKARLFVFAGQGRDGLMAQTRSEDNGRTWTPMESNGLKCIMPFCTIIPVDDGRRLIGLTNMRRPDAPQGVKTNIVVQSESTDGGLTWSAWRTVADMPGFQPCEPWVIRSPDGRQILCLMRENERKLGGLWMTSDDEGRTWTRPKQLPPGLWGDRHAAQYAPDGRLVVCFRDQWREGPSYHHFVAWVGRYEDIVSGRDGDYRIKLLHSYHGGDCGYPGVEVLPDGTFIATTYIKYREGPEKNSVVSARFKLSETDPLSKKAPR